MKDHAVLSPTAQNRLKKTKHAFFEKLVVCADRVDRAPSEEFPRLGCSSSVRCFASRLDLRNPLVSRLIDSGMRFSAVGFSRNETLQGDNTPSGFISQDA